MKRPQRAARNSAEYLAGFWPDWICPESGWAEILDDLGPFALARVVAKARLLPEPPSCAALAAFAVVEHRAASVPGLAACREALRGEG